MGAGISIYFPLESPALVTSLPALKAQILSIRRDPHGGPIDPFRRPWTLIRAHVLMAALFSTLAGSSPQTN